jgi:hypothetical protein
MIYRVLLKIGVGSEVCVGRSAQLEMLLDISLGKGRGC